MDTRYTTNGKKHGSNTEAGREKNKVSKHNIPERALSKLFKYLNNLGSKCVIKFCKE